MLIQFTKATRRHRIGRAHVLFVMASVAPTAIVTALGNTGLLYVGQDQTGRELEIITVELANPERRLVVHVMPTALRRK